MRVIEDTAHSIGAEYKGGHWQFSWFMGFYLNKNSTTIEGDFVVLHDDMLLTCFYGMDRETQNHLGKESSRQYKKVFYPDFKYNMMDL